VNTDNKRTLTQEDVMRPVRASLFPFGFIPQAFIPLTFILLGGCAKHDLRCDAHLTPINPAEPVAAPAGAKSDERDAP
jgi:hypothetical protein